MSEKEKFIEWYNSLSERTQRNLSFDMALIVWIGCAEQKNEVIQKLKIEVDSQSTSLAMWEEKYKQKSAEISDIKDELAWYG